MNGFVLRRDRLPGAGEELFLGIVLRLEHGGFGLRGFGPIDRGGALGCPRSALLGALRFRGVETPILPVGYGDAGAGRGQQDDGEQRGDDRGLVRERHASPGSIDGFRDSHHEPTGEPSSHRNAAFSTVNASNSSSRSGK